MDNDGWGWVLPVICILVICLFVVFIITDTRTDTLVVTERDLKTALDRVKEDLEVLEERIDRLVAQSDEH